MNFSNDLTVYRTALRALTKESAAMLAIAGDAMKDAAGYTNVACLQRRVDEAGALLDSVPLAPPETCAWRDEGWERVTGCGHRSSMLPSDPTRASIGWKGCPYCLRPLSLSSGGTPKGESK